MRYYCDYCDIFLTQGSAAVRRAHNVGRKHKEEVTNFFSQYLRDMPALQAAVDPLGSTNPFDVPPPSMGVHSDLFIVPLEDFSLPPPPLFVVPPHLVAKSTAEKAADERAARARAPMPIAPAAFVAGTKRKLSALDDDSGEDAGVNASAGDSAGASTSAGAGVGAGGEGDLAPAEQSADEVGHARAAKRQRVD